MKKNVLTLLTMVLVTSLSYAGGIVTNTNQSASFIRMMARDASVDVDAVFFNPAGLTHLEDGFYIQVNSQTISQSRTINNSALNKDYVGKTFVPVLPTAFLVYKMNNLAFSAGFEVIGGGGSANFPEGLPLFELQLANAAQNDLAKFGVTTYSADMSLTGSSVYYGIQAGVSYAINDMISIGVGARYVLANNTTVGHLKDIKFNFGGGDLVNANMFFNGQADALQPAVDATGQIVAGGGGKFTLAQLQGAGIITAEEKAQLVGALKALGLTDDQINAMNAEMINGTFTGAQTQLKGAAASFADKEADVSQKGTGITPIISLDLDMGALGISLKYEHKTAMNVTTAVAKDDFGLYKDGEEVPNELPAMIAVGVRYQASDALKLQLGTHYYLDKGAKYGKKNDSGDFVTNGETTKIGGKDASYLAGNTFEVAGGLEYQLSELLQVSAGVLYVKTNPNPEYQSSLSYTLSTTTLGGGLSYIISDNLGIEAGLSYTIYQPFTRDYTAYKETYDKSALVFALGVNYRM